MKRVAFWFVVILMTFTVNSQSINGNYTFIVDSVKCKMIYVAGGEYDMVGNFKGTDKRRLVSDFYIGETEVTQGLWSAVMSGAKPSYFKGYPNHPVEQVSWNDCKRFVDILNEMALAPDGYKFALPSSAQWEYAARGGKESIGEYGVAPDYKYAGSNNIDEVAWVGENCKANSNQHQTHDVMTKKQNSLGIYDMTGNVWEWCDDEVMGNRRIIRGSSWNDFESGIDPLMHKHDISCYNHNRQNEAYYSIGMRLVMVSIQ